MNRIIRNIGLVSTLSLLTAFSSAQVFPAGPPVRSVELGNTTINWTVPVTPAEYDDCVAEVARVWSDEFDVYVGQNWVNEGGLASQWGWSQGCFLLPPGVSALDAVGFLEGIEVWADEPSVTQFVWPQEDGASNGRAVFINNAARVFGMLGAGIAPPPVVFELEPYLDHVLGIALNAAMTDGAENVTRNCSLSYSFGSEHAVAPSIPFRCTVSIEGFEDAPDAFFVELQVVLDSGLEFTYP